MLSFTSHHVLICPSDSQAWWQLCQSFFWHQWCWIRSTAQVEYRGHRRRLVRYTIPISQPPTHDAEITATTTRPRPLDHHSHVLSSSQPSLQTLHRPYHGSLASSGSTYPWYRASADTPSHAPIAINPARRVGLSHQL